MCCSVDHKLQIDEIWMEFCCENQYTLIDIYKNVLLCFDHEHQIDEIWMEFCCEEKFTAKQEFVETETKKYEFEEETEIVEDFGKVPQKNIVLS